MEVLSTAQRTAFARGAMPELERVRPGVLAVPQEMPDLRLGYSLSYLVVHAGEAHLIDTGMPTERNWQLLEEALALEGVTMADVASVTLTHLHRDHAGLAERVRLHSGAVVRMHEADARAVRAGMPRIDAQRFELSLERWSVPEEAAAILREEVLQTSVPEVAVTIDEEVSDGQMLTIGHLPARVLHTPGHTAGHIVLAVDEAHDPGGEDADEPVGEDDTAGHPSDARGGRGFVFTGDHVLPTISTGLGLGGMDESFDPLPDYLRSVARVRDLGGVEVCPGHGYRFRGADERSTEILEHHARRRDAVAEALSADPRLTIWELSRELWCRRGWDDMSPHTRFSALGQAEMIARAVRGA